MDADGLHPRPLLRGRRGDEDRKTMLILLYVY